MTRYLWTGIWVMLFAVAAQADSGTSLGMGECYSALARGVDALYWNPANLALKDGKNHGSLTLFSITAGLGNNSLNQSLYNEYFTDENKILSAEDVDRLLDNISDDGLKLESLTDVSLFSFAFGNFAFGFATTGVSESMVPKQMLELPLRGVSQQSYVFQPTGMAEAAGKIHLAYGHTLARYKTLYVFNRPVLDIDDIAVGVRVSYLFGLASFRTESATVNTYITNAGVGAQGSYSGVGSYPGGGRVPGSGLGLDLGFSVTTPRHYTFSIVLRNLYHRINWRNNTRAWTGELNTGAPRFIFGDNAISDLDGDEIFTDEELLNQEYATSRPTDVRIGLGWTGRHGMYALETGSRDQRFMAALGGGISRAIVHLYGGLRWCDGTYFHGGLGLGGDALMVDVGLASRGGLTANASKGVIFAGSLRVGW